MAFTVEAIDHIVLSVADVDVSAAWYQRVLGMRRLDHPPGPGRAPRTAMTFGRQKINLRPIAESQADWFTGKTPSTGGGDLCFVTTAAPKFTLEHLHACGVAVERGPVARLGARGEMTSIYCRDPDGSLIEISTYG